MMTDNNPHVVIPNKREYSTITPSFDDSQTQQGIIKKLKVDNDEDVPKKPKKIVSWAPDGDLVKVKFFEKENTVTGKDVRSALKDEILGERALIMAKRQQEIDDWKTRKEEMKPSIQWDYPITINFEGKEPPSVKTRHERKETPEEIRLREREENSLMAIYFNEEDIPFSPEEPKEPHAIPVEYDDTTIKVIRETNIPISNYQLNIDKIGQQGMNPNILQFLPQMMSQSMLPQGQIFYQNIPNMPNLPPNMTNLPPNMTNLPPNMPNIPNMPNMGIPNPHAFGTMPSFARGPMHGGNMGYNNLQQHKHDTIRLGDLNIIPTMYNTSFLKSPKDINKKNECKFFSKGRCEYGAKCKYIHIEYPQFNR